MSPAPPCTRDDATAVVRRLRDAGHVAYFAGGCVRDELLGLTPKDYDVATDAPPQRVRQLFANTQAVGAAFGVILVRLGRSTIEVATFRTDGTYTDGRRPDTVTFATAEADAQRRDFTINGLFLDPLDGNKVIDYVGGRADLDAKLIRAIGNADDRFAEDGLRLLRAVRFASRLGFPIEPKTADAIRHHAAELPRISPERVGDEMRRMLTSRGRIQAVGTLHDLGLAEQMFRLMPIDGNHPPSLGPLAAVYLVGSRCFGAAMAGLALDWRWQRAGGHVDPRQWLTKTEVTHAVQAVRRALKLSNEELSDMEGTLIGTGTMAVEPEPGIAAKKRFLATATAAPAMDLLAAMAAVGLRGRRFNPPLQELAALSKADVAPPPLVTGDDLTAAGATPGPAFKRALDAAYDAQLEDRVTDRSAALRLALDVIQAAPAAGSLQRP